VTHPAVGSAAPRFVLRTQHGEDLSPIGDGSPTLLVFFPFAFSSICSAELGDLEQYLGAFRAANVQVVGVSCDPIYSLRAMADAQDLTFALASDFWPHGDVARAYDCFDEGLGAATRSSFLVRPDGEVCWSVHRPMAERRNVQDHLDALPRLS